MAESVLMGELSWPEFEAKIARPNLPTSDGQQPVPAGARG